MHKVLSFLFFSLVISLGITAQNNIYNNESIVLSDSSTINNSHLNTNLISEKTMTHSDSNKKSPLLIPTFKKSQLIINQDKRIELLSKLYLKEKTTRGYKIQLYSSHSRWEAEKAKSSFIAQYSDFPTPDLIYQTPNFKIRFGNFRNRFAAEKYIREIKENYPTAFLVKDEISVKLK